MDDKEWKEFDKEERDELARAKWRMRKLLRTMDTCETEAAIAFVEDYRRRWAEEEGKTPLLGPLPPPPPGMEFTIEDLANEYLNMMRRNSPEPFDPNKIQ